MSMDKVNREKSVFEVQLEDVKRNLGEALRLVSMVINPDYDRETNLTEARQIITDALAVLDNMEEPEPTNPKEPKDNSLPPCSDCVRAESSCGFDRLTCTSPEDIHVLNQAGPEEPREGVVEDPFPEERRRATLDGGSTPYTEEGE